jgi:hypothetical protein
LVPVLIAAVEIARRLPASREPEMRHVFADA